MMNRGAASDDRSHASFCGEQGEQQLSVELPIGRFHGQEKGCLERCRHDTSP
jgi:hypothetical protein